MRSCGVSADAQPAQPAQFRSGVERIAIDVQVVDKSGRPVPHLTADDFDVRLNQHPRKVVSVEYVQAAGIDTPAGGGGASSPFGQAVGNADNPGGRDFVLAIDESSFRAIDAPAVMRAARAFIARLAPEDRVGLFTFPVSPEFFPLTPDHLQVELELDRVTGTFSLPGSRFHLSPAEVMDIESGDQDMVKSVARRECLPQQSFQTECLRAIPVDANAQVEAYESMTSASTNALRRLFAALPQDPKRKTVVVISGGLFASDRAGGRPDIGSVLDLLTIDAARANANVYVLHIDSSFLQAFSASNGSAISRSLMRESSALRSGLERLAAVAGGAFVHVETGGDDSAFRRILRETSAYYLIGVEPLDEDRDGRSHSISVRTRQPGMDVRSRRSVVIPGR